MSPGYKIVNKEKQQLNWTSSKAKLKHLTKKEADFEAELTNCINSTVRSEHILCICYIYIYIYIFFFSFFISFQVFSTQQRDRKTKKLV